MKGTDEDQIKEEKNKSSYRRTGLKCSFYPGESNNFKPIQSFIIFKILMFPRGAAGDQHNNAEAVLKLIN